MAREIMAISRVLGDYEPTFEGFNSPIRIILATSSQGTLPIASASSVMFKLFLKSGLLVFYTLGCFCFWTLFGAGPSAILSFLAKVTS